jgi:hypothetical protein
VPTLPLQKYLGVRVGTRDGKPVLATFCDSTVTSGRKYPALRVGTRDGKPVFVLLNCDATKTNSKALLRVGTRDGKPVFAMACCGGGVCGSVCASYTCTASPAYFGQGGSLGVPITIKLGTTTIGSGVTTGHIGRLTRTGAGSGYTDGNYTNGTFSGGGGSGGKFAYVISGGQLQPFPSLATTDSGDNYTSTPTAILNAGPGTGASITVDLGYWFCTTITSAATYTASSSAGCGSGSVAAVCNASPNTITIQSTARLTLTLRKCGGTTASPTNPIPPTRVTVSGNGFSSTTNATFGVTGPLSICVPGDGTYSVTIHDLTTPNPSYQDVTTSVTVANCAGPATIDLPPNRYTYTYRVQGCANLVLAGASVDFTWFDGSTTATTNASGEATASLPANCPITVTASKSRFVSSTPVVYTAQFGNSYGGATTLLGNVILSVATGYRCLTHWPGDADPTANNCCADPVPNTLFLTDSNGIHSAGSSQTACYSFTYNGTSYPSGTPGSDCSDLSIPGSQYCSVAIKFLFGCSVRGGVLKLVLTISTPFCRKGLDGSVAPMPGTCFGGDAQYSNCAGTTHSAGSLYGVDSIIAMPTNCGPLTATFPVTDPLLSAIVGSSVTLGE